MKQAVRYVYTAQVTDYDEKNNLVKVLGMGFGLPEKISVKPGDEVKIILEIPLNGAENAKP